MANSLPCRRQIPLRRDARGERERSFSNSKFVDEGPRLQCAEGKVARGSVKGAFRGVQDVVGGMRRRRVVVRWRERCIFGCGGWGGCRRRSQDFIVVQRKSMSREREIYIYIYISNPPQKLLPKKTEYGSKFCVMTFFWLGRTKSIDTLSIIYHRCTGKEETTVPYYGMN